jgi:ankyrin repeat protein
VKDPPYGFNKLAAEFLDTATVLIPGRSGLAQAARAYSHLPADISSETRERLRNVHNAFSALNAVVNKYLEGERKSGLSKKFRRMFADSEIDKLTHSLAHCRQALKRTSDAQGWHLNPDQIEPAAGIGYTALSAVMEKPDPTRCRNESPPPPRLDSRAPQIPSSIPSPSLEQYGTITTRLDMPTPPLPSSGHIDREQAVASPYSWNSSNSSNSKSPVSNAYSSRASISAQTVATSIMDDLKQTPERPVRMTPRSSSVANLAGSKTSLLAAVQQMQHKIMEQLLDSGVPADHGPDYNLLSIAIVNADFTGLRLLLMFNADPNSKGKDGLTALFIATQASFVDAAQLLLQYGADPNLCAGSHGENAFARALNTSQSQLVDLLLRFGAQPDLIMENGNTPFIQAVTKTVPMNLMEMMLQHNADPNAKNGRGESALFKAINAERLDIVSLLVDHGANVNLPAPKHMLWPAVHQPKTLELLLESGADLRRAPGVLELASSINSIEAVMILIKHGVDVNAKKDGIFTPLCTSIRDDHANLVDILLEAGADPNLQASEFPAFKCITHHRPHLLPRIIAAGADLNKPPGIVETAVACGERESLLILLEHGADPNARTPSGNTALTTAIRLNRHEFIDILLTNGADPGVRGQEWPIAMAVKSPLILAKLLPRIPKAKIIKGALELAVVANQLESVKLLLDKGVSVEEKNGGVFSPLTTSIREDRKAIFQYLIDEVSVKHANAATV